MSDLWKFENLEQQMTYTLGQAVRDTVEILHSNSRKVKLRKGYVEDFQKEFVRIYTDTKALMKGGTGSDICPHKKAAVACLAALSVCPLVVPSNGGGHSANSVVAYFLAVRIIRNYQIYRYFPNDVMKQKKLRSVLGTITVPTLLNDHQAVKVNIILAITQMSEVLRGWSHPADLSLMLSSFLFYVDSYSYHDVESAGASI